MYLQTYANAGSQTSSGRQGTCQMAAGPVGLKKEYFSQNLNIQISSTKPSRRSVDSQKETQ